MTTKATTARPERVVICGQPFAVKWEERPGVRLTEADGFWNHAVTDTGDQLIAMRTLQAPFQLRDTLIHEILHAIVSLTGQQDRFKPYDLNKDHPEEPVVNALATALLAVIRENPSVLTWLTEADPSDDR